MSTIGNLRKKARKFLFLDLFGEVPNLYIDNHKKYRTTFGLACTMLFGIIAILCIWVFGKEIIFREFPNIAVEERYTAKPSRYNINKETFNFA